MIVFSIGGYIIYQTVKEVVAVETDYALVYNFMVSKNAIERGQKIENLQTAKVKITRLIGVQKIDTSYNFTDTIAVHPQLQRLEPHRKLTTYRNINDQNYEFQLLEVFIEEGDVIDGVVSVISRLFLGLSLVILLFSFLISRKLLQPFQLILNKISSFNLKSKQPLDLPKTSTKEFQKLNHFIEKMTLKARRDYVTLKEFSENASHEMQTPIAIAKGKLELLLESKDLEPEQLGLIQSAQEALSKLSKMGKSLSLLTKIENQEFSNQKPIDFSRAVASSIDFFSEISSFKGIQIETEIEPNVQVKIDESLADILIGNLMKNAIHHNFENGKIKVELDSDKLRITNSGLPPSIPTAQLFERFKKSDQTSQSLGLGLSIVKKICNVSDFKIRYDYENETHILQINF